MSLTDDTITPLEMAQELATHYNAIRPGCAQLQVYEGQPHVFTGKYKVVAARDIYIFIMDRIVGELS